MIDIVRIDESFSRWNELLALILSSFAYMEGVIDPPSSATRLTLAALAYKARDEIAFIAVEGERLVGCIFCRPEPESLYVGKFAVSPSHQGKGIGAKLLAVAEEVAREKSLPRLRLETRIELTGNHATFTRWGFVKTAETSHPGFTRTTTIEMQKPLA
ncbi:GNAT family N-acetyltransferase [Rhizobium sp. NTR19]|uniref:GNAT family N-acetyltransferase n=1 Tax=Neorhizobium turbinariae TaxID=2937795 RepID=A0ABT0IVV7_9HYPH|nr:GNAT family N-acetyltransferase [Neorhizobium turbinariae]MCK8782025.1 GNAT family N-acetyltransferase [Neorhizobium turbinariae]